MFVIDYSKKKLEYTPYYSKKENCFYTEPHAPGDFSLMLGQGYLSLDLRFPDQLVCCLNGLSSKESWKKRKLRFPKAPEGRLFFKSDIELIQGCGISYSESWQAFFCATNKVVCFCSPKYNKNKPCFSVEFNINTVAILENRELVAIWIQL